MWIGIMVLFLVLFASCFFYSIFAMMNDNEFSEFGFVDSDASDCFDGYTETMRHGHSVLGRLVRHGRVWFVKSYDLGGDLTEAEMRLRKEYELLIRLNHPGVVRAGWVEHIPDAGFCLAMEYVEGVTLDSFLVSATKGECRLISESLLKTMAYIHSQGISHLDLKPQNIMVVGRGETLGVKIVDFGMSAWGGNVLFRSGGGTRSYGAPEQFDDGYRPSHRSDVYSLGLLLQQIDGGWGYRSVARRAIRVSPDERPEDAGELLALVRRSRRYCRGLIIGLAIAAVAFIATIGIKQMRFSEPKIKSVDAEQNIVVPEEPEGRVDTVIMPEVAPQKESHSPKVVEAKEDNIEDEYDLLVEQWLKEMNRRSDQMQAVASREEMSVAQRKKLIEQMNDTLLEDTYNFFQPYRARFAPDGKVVLPNAMGTIYEPRFQTVRRRMAEVYHSLKE